MGISKVTSFSFLSLPLLSRWRVFLGLRLFREEVLFLPRLSQEGSFLLGRCYFLRRSFLVKVKQGVVHAGIKKSTIAMSVRDLFNSTSSVV